ncbi:MAG: Y-family DNA polymerase [Patescibacteria group bacterium]|nr:Y-family DNA polymerase [Patescibacteria group bacterium]
MKQLLFALIDCNNFFVSCERIFRPDLAHRPVVVLSSNDGCAVARSNEAKALGIPMGAPAFKYRDLFRDNGVVQFSANFELYGDISDRISRLLTAVTPHIELYSVDESFLDLQELDIADYAVWGQALRQRIMREIGVPTSIGIATSKTLAKLATEHVKKMPALRGALDLITASASEQAAYLQATTIEDIWGVGRRLAPKLKAESIFTAHDLARMNPRRAQQLMGIHGRQMVTELNGTSCLPLEKVSKVRQTVMHGRQFGEDTNDVRVLEAAVASLTAKAAFRLRNDSLLARGACITLSTNRLKPGYQQVSRYLTFITPTADTGIITQQLMLALGTMYNSRSQYHRANVLLYNLQPETALQADLFGDVDLVASSQSLHRMEALDAINKRYGSSTIRFAAEDLSRAWQPKRQLRSPRYTTRWTDLPSAQLSL